MKKGRMACLPQRENAKIRLSVMVNQEAYNSYVSAKLKATIGRERAQKMSAPTGYMPFFEQYSLRGIF